MGSSGRISTGSLQTDQNLHFGVLGPVAVWRGARDVHFGSGKHRLLLAALLLHPNERVDRDVIIDLVWGSRPPKSVVNLVQKYVGELRRSFGPDGRALECLPGGYRLRLTETQLDCWTFEHLVTRACASTDPRTAEIHFTHALALWRGRAFSEIDAEPAAIVRAKLDEHRIAALEDVAELKIERGEHRAVVAELARLTTQFPLRERLRELQMLALCRSDRRADALRVYADVRNLLTDQLGVGPGQSLRRRHEQILRADQEPAPDRDTAVRGHAVQPLPTCQLPPDLPDFTGRTAEVAALTDRLANHAEGAPPPVAVVVGAPGVGKSSIAVHAAHAVSAAFPDGQLYLDLAGTSDEPRDPATMLAEVLRVLGINGAGVPDELSARAALYRSLLADRRLLLVLDDAASVDQVRPLVPGTGRSALLITSRRRLPELPCVRHVDLDVLEQADAVRLFASIVGADRVTREPAHAAAIMRFCGCLPLAVRIAGAKLASRDTWSLSILHERLSDESRLLRELSVGELAVQTNFALSLRHLPARAVRAFRLLGLLGPCTVPGWVLGPLLDEDEADETLDLLVDANLLRQAGTDLLGGPRYRMHDLLRAYAVAGAADIDAAEQHAAMTRLLGAWLWLAERAVDRLPPSLFRPPAGMSPRTPVSGAVLRRVVANPLAWFDSERRALVGAVKLAADGGLDEQAWELAATAVSYYDHRSHYEDWQDVHQVALAPVRAAGNRLGEAVLLRAFGQVHLYRDHYDQAVAMLTRSERLFAEVGDKRGEALAIAGLGSVHRARGDIDAALDKAKEALDMLTLVGERHVEAQLRSSIAAMLLTRGAVAESHLWFTDALRLARELRDTHREASVLARMSALHEHRGDQDDALSCLRESLRIFDDLQDEQCAAMYALLNLGRLHARRGDRRESEQALRRAADICHRHGHRREEAECWQLLGELDARHGDGDDAPRLLRRSLRLWREFGTAAQIAAAETALHAFT